MAYFELLLTEEAALDIGDAQRWYQEQAGLGAAFVSQVEKQLEFIERHPMACADIAHGIRRSVLKKFPYNIYYSINGAFINVLAVWHGGRDQERLIARCS